MNSAYNHQHVYNLSVIKEAKRWAKHNFITADQLARINQEYKTPFYHPNLIIRILLFIATLLALSGVTGLFFLFFSGSGETGISITSIIYGIGSFLTLEKMFIAKNHYKSGVTEAIMYHACGFTIGGVGGLVDFDSPQLMLITSLLVFAFAGWRYLDLLTTVCAVLSFAGLLFYNFYEAGGILQQIIPFVFIIAFGLLYWGIKKLKRNAKHKLWTNNLIIVEVISLLFIYAAGNYLVVRELSVNLMNLELQEGDNIPFAFLFYLLTVIIPVGFLVAGIRNKDLVLLRVSLVALAFSVFTFKYYYSLGHTEITLTLAGAILIGIAIMLMRYLKVMRNGFTGDNLLSERWADMNVEALVISQTMGGNVAHAGSTDVGGGGDSGGGGASTKF
jgi:uncharacterized membrane protein YgcG